MEDWVTVQSDKSYSDVEQHVSVEINDKTIPCSNQDFIRNFIANDGSTLPGTYNGILGEAATASNNGQFQSNINYKINQRMLSDSNKLALPRTHLEELKALTAQIIDANSSNAGKLEVEALNLITTTFIGGTSENDAEKNPIQESVPAF